jgi:hypothetical protein
MRYLLSYKQHIALQNSNYVKNFSSFIDFEEEEENEEEEEEDDDDDEILHKIKVKLFETFKNELRRNEN